MVLCCNTDTRCADSLGPPYDGGAEGDGGHEVFHVTIKVGGDTSPVLDAAEHALDTVCTPSNLLEDPTFHKMNLGESPLYDLDQLQILSVSVK